VKVLGNQNTKALNATKALINIISPTATGSAGKNLKEAAQAVIDLKVAARAEKSAFGSIIKIADNDKVGRLVNLRPVKSLVASKLSQAANVGPLRSALDRVSRNLDIKGNVTFSKLQGVKDDIDTLIEKGLGKGDKLTKKTMRSLLEVKSSLLNQMDSVSPSFKQARETFAKESKPVNELQESIIGRLSELTDKQLRTASSEIFNPRTTAKEITQIKKAIDQVDPKSWNDIVRSELDFRVGNIITKADEVGAGGVLNMPGQLKKAIFGNANKREVLLRSLGAEQRKNFVFLETVLDRAAAGRQSGSQTFSRGDSKERLKSSLGKLKDIFFRPLDSAQKVGDEALFNRNARALADILLDPNAATEVAKIRSPRTSVQQASKILFQLFKDREEDLKNKQTKQGEK
jgi:hypothetical protein